MLWFTFIGGKYSQRKLIHIIKRLVAGMVNLVFPHWWESHGSELVTLGFATKAENTAGWSFADRETEEIKGWRSTASSVGINITEEGIRAPTCHLQDIGHLVKLKVREGTNMLLRNMFPNVQVNCIHFWNTSPCLWLLYIQ